MDIHFPSNLIYLNLKKNLLEQVLYFHMATRRQLALSTVTSETMKAFKKKKVVSVHSELSAIERR